MIGRRSVLRLLTGGAALFAHGANSQSRYEAVRKRQDPDANLYIIRHNTAYWNYGTVKVDGRKIAALHSEQYTALRVEPGRHEVYIGFSFFAVFDSTQKISVDVQDGRTTYVEISGSDEWADCRPDGPDRYSDACKSSVSDAAGYQYRTLINEVSEGYAREAMEYCAFVAPDGD